MDKSQEKKGNKKGKIQIPLIGQLATKNRLITQEELQKGLAHCSDSKDKENALKEYFLKNELISEKNIKRLTRATKAFEFRLKEFRFGAIAVRKGFINQSVLTLVLEEQEKKFKKDKRISQIGELLVDAGFLTEKQCEYILKLQKRKRLELPKISKEEKQTAGVAKKAQKDQDSGEQAGESSGATSGQIPEKTAQNVSKKASEKNAEEISSEIIAKGTDDKSLLIEPEIISGGIKLDIAKNFMVAFLTKTDSFDTNITPDQIKETLFDKDIISGVVVDEMLLGFITSSGFKTKPFKVAQGILPIQGKDATVEFFFNTDYLKAGGVVDDGAIDFKDRGEIPSVEEGTVLAEKIPLIESRNGHNIYGEVVETIPSEDVPMKCGDGVRLSEDGVKVLADVSGVPKYTLAGQIFVYNEYVTKGDVDFETGHVDFNGNINVNGRIKSGFNVTGNDIKAIELDGGKITAEGNVTLSGGVTGGEIYARGNVFAKFINQAKINCMGDVITENELVDSDVECSGKCAVGKKIISSRIASKMGVQTNQIGTEKSGPSVVRVGYDAFLKNELDTNKGHLDNLANKIKTFSDRKKEMQQQAKDLQEQVTELAHIQDRSQLEQKEINSKIASMEKEDELIKEMVSKIEQLKADAIDAEKKLDTCFDQTDKIDERMEQEDSQIKRLEKKRDDLLTERKNLIQLGKESPGKSVVIVNGRIMPGTVIKGLHSEKKVTEVTSHARIEEALLSVEGGENRIAYEMKVNNI